MPTSSPWFSDLRSILASARGDGLRAEIVRGGMGSFGLKAAQTVLTLGLMVLLARMLGAEGYGLYAYMLAVVEILGIPVQTGVGTLAVREVAGYEERREWGLLRGFLRFGSFSIIAFSVLLAVGVCTVFEVLPLGWSREKYLTLAAGLLLLPLRALSNYLGAALRGLKKIVRGLLPENVLRPGGFLLLSVGVWLLPSELSLTPSRTMLFHATAAAGALIIGGWMLIRELPRDSAVASPDYEVGAWLSSIGPLSLITGMQLINSRADLVMLGILGTSADVGIYRVAAQGGVLVIFGLKAMNMAVAPHFSSLWASDDRERLQRVVTAAARAALLVAVPIVLVFLVAGDRVLGLVFGREFASGHVALSIISVGQLINAGVGSVVLLLNMTGQETVVVRGLMIAAVSNILLNLLLIPLWGIEGAAIATVLTFGIWNVGLWRSTKKRMDIDTMAVGGRIATNLLIRRDDGRE